MAFDQAVVDLVQNTFGGKIWHATSLLDKLGSSNNQIGTMVQIAFSIAALMFIIQLVIMVLNISKSGGNIWENLGPLVFRTLILCAIISGPVYNLLFKTTITGMTDGIASAISGDYIKNFVDSWQKMFQGSAQAQMKPWDILSASFATSLVTNILSSLIFIIAGVCVFIITQLQPYLWLFAYYTGPLCLAFAFCDLTSHVAKNWLNLFLQVNFIGVFGSIAFLVAQAAGLADNLSVGSAANNIILVAVYGILSIIFFCSIYPLTAYIFSGNSQIGAAATPQGAGAAAGSAMVIYGGAMAAAGSMLQKYGAEGGKMASMGKGMSSHGDSVSGKGADIQRVLRGNAPSKSRSGNESGRGSAGQGSEQQQSSIPSNQQNPTGGAQGGMKGSQPTKPSV